MGEKYNKRKKGQGHLEIILSFVLFLGALIFLFLFINPFATSDEISVIGGVKDKIIRNVSLEIGKLSVVTNTTGDCYELDVKITKKYGGTYVEKKNIENPRKYDIYFSEIFGPGGPPTCNSKPSNYTLGVYSKEKIIVYEKIQGLIFRYNSDYGGLKNELGISNDFEFNFKTLNNQKITGLNVSKEHTGIGNIEANEFPVRVINNSGDIQYLKFNLLAWA